MGVEGAQGSALLSAATDVKDVGDRYGSDDCGDADDHHQLDQSESFVHRFYLSGRAGFQAAGWWTQDAARHTRVVVPAASRHHERWKGIWLRPRIAQIQRCS